MRFGVTETPELLSVSDTMGGDLHSPSHLGINTVTECELKYLHILAGLCCEGCLTCASLFCDLVRHLVDPSPGAAPEPAGGIQTLGTDDPLSPAAACVAALPTAPLHWSSEPSLRRRAPALQRWAPCRGCGLRLDPGQDDVIGPLKSGLLAGLVWELEGRALWFCLRNEKG